MTTMQSWLQSVLPEQWRVEGYPPHSKFVWMGQSSGGEAQARLLEESKLAWRREKEHDLGLGS